MRITLLGTGSADGWPNPFCTCTSCGAERRDGRSRAPSSALVDDVLLVDCGPTTPHPRGGSGVSLAAVEHVLLTHGHPDHLHPAFLLSRSWTSTSRPLQVWGPRAAIDLCRDWIGPATDVTLHPVAPFDRLVLDSAVGAHAVHVLPAAHAHGDGDLLAEEAVLFAITGPDGDRLLYATDTGPLAVETVEAIDGSCDVLVIDETFGDLHTHGTGHLDLATLPVLLEALRQRGVVTESTRIVATHLSHHNPPTGELRRRLEPLGVEVGEDHDVIDTARRLGRHRLLIGGARSGKSHIAEDWAGRSPVVVYVATGGSRPDDPEWAERIAAHRARRPSHWTTVEATDITALLEGARAGTCVLVDCLALWLTAQLDAVDAWTRSDAGAAAAARDEVAARVTALLHAVRGCEADVILVTNEVGMGVVPATTSGRLFRDELGQLNAQAAAACDDAHLVVAGRLLALTPADRWSTRD